MIQVLNYLGSINETNKTTEKPLFLKDSKTAAKNFGFNTVVSDRNPRHKFLFFVNFVRPSNRNGGFNRYADWNIGISLLVKSISNPSFDVQTEVLNQYNKRRLIQKKIEFSPINITFYDTYDQRVTRMFKEYIAYYYGQFKNATLNSWNYDITTPDFQYVDGNNTEWGFVPSGTNDLNDHYFFERIEIYRFGCAKYSKFSLIHPLISSFSVSDEDYGEGNSYHLITVKIDYEGIVFEQDNELIDSEVVELASLNIGEYAKILSQPQRFNFPSIPSVLQNNTPKISQQNLGISRPEKINLQQNIQSDNYRQNNSLLGGIFGNSLPSWSNNVVTQGINPNAPAPGENNLQGIQFIGSNTSSFGNLNSRQNNTRNDNLTNRLLSIFGI